MPDAHITKLITRGTGNRLLDAFVRENPAMQAGMQPVTYLAGHVVYRQDRPISHAYFPVAGALALTISIHGRPGFIARWRSFLKLTSIATRHASGSVPS
jgi:hypothetical protein